MTKFSQNVLEYFDDMALISNGEFYKHDMCFATRELVVGDEDVDAEPELEPYLGKKLKQEGIRSYNHGWGSYNEVEVFELQIVIVPEVVIPAHESTKWVKVSK